MAGAGLEPQATGCAATRQMPDQPAASAPCPTCMP